MRSSRYSKPKRTLWQRKPFWLALFLLIIAGGAGWYFRLGPGNALITPASASGGPDYNTATVRRGNIQLSASGSGTLVTSQSVDLRFSTRGTVTQLNVKVGDMVKTGQVLAQMGNSQAIEASIASAQLSLLQAQQALSDLQTGASTSLAQAYQNLIKAQDTYQNAVTTQERTAYARCSKQVNTKYAAALDKATQNLNKMGPGDVGTDAWVTAKNNYDTALANYNYCISYTPTEKTDAQASVDVAKVALQQAQQTYDTLKKASGIDPNQQALDEAKVNQAQTQLADAQKQLSGLTLTAPMDGKVIAIAAGQGAIVDTSTFITIADISHPTIQLSLDETDLNKLLMNSAVEVTFDALPGQVFNGKIVQVEPQLVKSGQYQVAQGLAELDDTAAKALQNMPLGLNASVTVIDKQAMNTLIVPIQALRDLGGNQYAVFVVDQNGQLLLRPVQVGLMDTTSAQIVSGLNAGEVVSTGLAKTNSGTSNTGR